ncbi:hypothetical protein SPF06_14135 [Sinomonas sp. JGH33]|uniref:Uncharacterized protein n=1 Tax=Sinomonas terricola TaxID=3110330 RepID=A0ABU5T854_9MICC|nr:hypothetical protein [Sinomonas sp. JGH33]MEA5455869.1 hypothetical protein [Sinomonas sp. JGH33]
MKRGKRLAAWLGGAVVVLVLVLAGLRLWDVHRTTNDWALWPPAAPSKVQFAGRDYACEPAASMSLNGLSVRGKTAGGADIYAPAVGSVSVTIVVKADDGLHACGLLGGP